MELFGAFKLQVVVIVATAVTTGVATDLNDIIYQFPLRSILSKMLLDRKAHLAEKLVKTELGLLERYRQLNPSMGIALAIDSTKGFWIKCNNGRHNVISGIVRISAVSMPDQCKTALERNGTNYTITARGCSLKTKLTGNGENENVTAKYIIKMTFDLAIDLSEENKKLKVEETRDGIFVNRLPNFKLRPNGECIFTKSTLGELAKLLKNTFVGHFVEVIRGILGPYPVGSQKPHRQTVGRDLRNL